MDGLFNVHVQFKVWGHQADKETDLTVADNDPQYLFFWPPLPVLAYSSTPLTLALHSVTYVMSNSCTIKDFDKWEINPFLSGGCNTFASKLNESMKGALSHILAHVESAAEAPQCRQSDEEKRASYHPWLWAETHKVEDGCSEVSVGISPNSIHEVQCITKPPSQKAWLLYYITWVQN